MARVDPILRLEDYKAALEFYIIELGRASDGIVFVENFDSDVTALRLLAKSRAVDKQVEFIANYGKHSCPGRDRSYGEFRLIDYAMAKSNLIASAGQDGVVWKITGRYQVRNLAKIVASAPRRFDLYCDARRYPIPWLDLRLMAWTRAGYEHWLQGITDRLATDPREPVMFHYVTRLADRAGITLRYRVEPLVKGVRGWDNRPYSDGSAAIKYLIRSLARRFAPFLWI